MSQEQFEKMRTTRGFIAALDQSGGSTPTALEHYGLDKTAYSSEVEMYDLVHEMRARIMTSPAFTGDRILGAILFEKTMDRRVDGLATADYLWQRKQIVPFLKVDRGLAPDVDGAQVMKPIPDLGALLDKAKGYRIFGTKMRSLITLAHRAGVEAVVDQQFELARRILDAGLLPIIEPEIDIHSMQKEPAEDLLKESILEHLAALGPHDQVMLKLTLPEEDGFYADLVEHDRVLRVVALSGGYSRLEADERLERNHGVVASFSRALTEGLTAQQTDDDFDATLHTSVESIYRASIT